MTLLASWVGVDTHGTTSAYIVSDSRFSWDDIRRYNFGRKVFASTRYPEIFGYAGDVLFPSTVLAQLLQMIDSDLLFNWSMTCEQKHEIVYQKLVSSFNEYPTACANKNIQIVHISRDTINERYPVFSCYLFSWSNGGWSAIKKNIPEESGIFIKLGPKSARSEFEERYKGYQSGNNRSTSRNVFHCFVDTLVNIKDHTCGGAPQLVGLYRKPKSSGINFGILYRGKRYFLGSELTGEVSYDKIQWRNELFEICDGTTGEIAKDAMRQPASHGKM